METIQMQLYELFFYLGKLATSEKEEEKKRERERKDNNNKEKVPVLLPCHYTATTVIRQPTNHSVCQSNNKPNQ